jgi:hypothetical protein
MTVLEIPALGGFHPGGPGAGEANAPLRGTGPARGAGGVSAPVVAAPDRLARPVGSRRQAVRFVALAGLTAVLPLGLGLGNPRFVPTLPGLDWTLALDARTAAAAAAVPGRKVVFIGGSNVRFGVDSAGLSRDLGLPVINYGLHASLGADVIADRAAACIGRGDVVVFSPELSHFRRADGDQYSDDIRIEFLLAHPDPNVDRRVQSFPVMQWREARGRCYRLRTWAESACATGLERAFDAVTGRPPPGPPPATPYSLDAVGSDGVITFRRPTACPIDRWSYSHPPSDVTAMSMDPDGSRGGRAFELLQRACADRHATLCVMPPLRLSVAHFDQANMAAMERAWIDFATAHGATALLPVGANVLPVADGYDTDYHLNDVGVATERPRLAAALRTVIGGGGDAAPAMAALPR